MQFPALPMDPAIRVTALLAVALAVALAVLLAVALYRLFFLVRLRGPVVLSELWIYPVKSCGGCRVQEAVMLRGGLQWDREFAITNSSHEVLSQKMFPIMASIKPTLHFSNDGDSVSSRLAAADSPATHRKPDAAGATTRETASR